MSTDNSQPTMGDQIVTDALYPAPSDVPADLSARTAPDMSNQAMDPQGNDATPVPAAAPSGKPGLWRNILAGALQGLAAGAATNTRGMGPGGALAAGAGAGVNQVVNVVPAQQRAAELQQTQLDNEKLMTAYHYAQLSQIQKQIHLMPESKQEQYLSQAADDASAMLKSGATVPASDASDLLTAQKQLQALHARNSWAVYSLAPIHGAEGLQYQVVQFPKAPIQKDLTLEGAGDDGSDITIPAGTPADKVGQYYTNYLNKKLQAENASDLESQKQQGQMQLADNNNAARQQRAAISASGTNVVAYDPEYQNADGSKGANVVLDKSTAQQRGLFSYKADPSAINANVAGMNDVQTKINQLADVTMDSRRMSQVQPELAAAILEHGKGIKLGISGTELDTSRINEGLYKEDVAKANQATRDFVTAFIGAHEAITQLPRLQTFGKSSRMTETQLHAALNMLPQAGDDAGLAQQKMLSLQNTIDPLRKQLPHMPGAELIPSWHEQQQKPPAATHVFDPLNGVLKVIGGQQ